jgi:AcrR family transcriptional regulator
MRTLSNPTGKAGRPRTFNEAEALDAAMRMFWRNGFEGASLSDLTQAMGINRPSLYATFGSKEALFRRAVERYMEGPAAYLQTAMEEPTARGVVEALLRGSLNLLSDPRNPHGCLLVEGSGGCGTEAEPARNEVRDRCRRGHSMLRRRFERAQADGDLPPDVDADDLARYVSTILNGLGIQAANGATRAQMMRVSEMALRTLPFN